MRGGGGRASMGQITKTDDQRTALSKHTKRASERNISKTYSCSHTMHHTRATYATSNVAIVRAYIYTRAEYYCLKVLYEYTKPTN